MCANRMNRAGNTGGGEYVGKGRRRESEGFIHAQVLLSNHKVVHTKRKDGGKKC